MKKCIVEGREYRIRFQRECPYLKTETKSGGFTNNLYCWITRNDCISDRTCHPPKNCPLEDV